MFVTFEGIEGSGKSTLMSAVAAALEARGYECITTREPGGTPTGDAVRELVLRSGTTITPVTEMLLMNASRAELVTHVIRPMLSEGVAVLCDRYVHSSLAYQGYGRGLPIELVRMTCMAATGGLMPDLTLYVDIGYETSRRRIDERALRRDRIEQEEAAFFERVRGGYKELAQRDSRIVELDGERPAAEVAAAALDALAKVLA